MRAELYNWRYESLAEQLSKEMKKRYFEVFVVHSKEELLETVKSIIPEGVSVSNGGSLTLTETGILDLLRSGNYVYYDRASAQTSQERKEIELKSFTVDYYLSSANAITSDGKLVFLDGNGNRVAAILYGPKNVVIIASVNKVVDDVENARRRLQFISPMNSKRLNLETPCTKIGYCVDCNNNQRICNYFVTVESSARQPGRIKVILTTFESGL
ncbi:MAG: lactate utilization protein [Fervidobacterium sp.]|uniref:lactate utilization protein n=1 Tax=Fervidobacterium sp. TaxID=1871331 RepID=UPI00404B40DB